VTGLSWVTLVVAPQHVAPDVYSALYLAWALPCALLLGLRVYAPQRAHRLAGAVRRRLPDGDLELTGRSSAPSGGR
jgi:hypothetical protein